MLEIPEAFTIANQLNNTIDGKQIVNVTAAHTPHKFSWFYGDPQSYHELLTGRFISRATGHGGLVEIEAEDAVLLFSDGVALRAHTENNKPPQKHQLLIEFNDGSALSVSVQMYGGLGCFPRGQLDNPYYKAAREKPSPLTERFDQDYFNHILSLPEVQKLSAKAFLATQQRIPGLGNGVLQDILYNSRVHPKTKISTLTALDKEILFEKVKSTLRDMADQGGRDTEKDLFADPGGYITRASKNTVGKSCPTCGNIIRKETYLGGSIYYCEGCQRI